MNAADLMLGDYVQIKDNEGRLITDFICDIGYVSQWNELGVRTCKCGEEWLKEQKWRKKRERIIHNQMVDFLNSLNKKR